MTAFDRPPLSLTGRTVDKYTLHNLIGQGGMASVYLAQKTHDLAQLHQNFSSLPHQPSSSSISSLFALKVMHPHLAQHQHSSTHFLKEISIGAQLKHPCICRLIDLGQIDQLPFLVMDYLEGQALSTLLYSEHIPALPLRVIASLMVDYTDALAYAHTLRDSSSRPLQLIHRDLSPHNLFVQYNGQGVVIDFGIAQARGTLDEDHVPMGKVAYMAPEQLNEEPINHQIDLWSLSVVLWELLTQSPLFEGDHVMQVMYQVLEKEIPLPSACRAKNLDDHTGTKKADQTDESFDHLSLFDQVVLAGLKRDPNQRSTHMLDWIQPIKEWLLHDLKQDYSSELETLGFDHVRRQEVQKWILHFFNPQHTLESHLEFSLLPTGIQPLVHSLIPHSSFPSSVSTTPSNSPLSSSNHNPFTQPLIKSPQNTHSSDQIEMNQHEPSSASSRSSVSFSPFSLDTHSLPNPKALIHTQSPREYSFPAPSDLQMNSALHSTSSVDPLFDSSPSQNLVQPLSNQPARFQKGAWITLTILLIGVILSWIFLYRS